MSHPLLLGRCTEDENTIVFESTFIDTVLCCTYKSSYLHPSNGFTLACRKGEARFDSDNVSALQILKEVISRGATQKQAKINITTGAVMQGATLVCLQHLMVADIKDESVMSCLQLLHPKVCCIGLIAVCVTSAVSQLEHQHQLAKHFKLIEALKVAACVLYCDTHAVCV